MTLPNQPKRMPTLNGKILAVYPGQGSQYTGMCRSLLGEFPYVREMFEQVEELFGMRIRHLCLAANRKELMQTMNTQPCLFAVSMAYQTVLQKEAGFRADLYAGHSLGEYSALTASGKLQLETACRLVKLRGQVMQTLVGKGEMLAVIGGNLATVERCLREVEENSGEIVDLANYNSPKQLVVSGTALGIRTVEERFNELDIKCIRVPVSAPFHSRLMSEVERELQEVIMATDFIDNDNLVIANYRGEIARYEADFLVKQISSPVHWIKTIDSASDYGCNICVEVGPKRILTSLLRSFPAWQDKKSYPLENSLREFLKILS